MKRKKHKKKSQSTFARFAKATAIAAGKPTTFALAALVIIVWGFTGPLFHFSDTWQLIINTGTTIATFLMVFLIQNTQNRDAQAVQLKLDELIRALPKAHTAVMDLEQLTDAELDHIQHAYCKLAEKGRNDLRSGGSDTGTPEVVLEKFGSKMSQPSKTEG